MAEENAPCCKVGRSLAAFGRAAYSDELARIAREEDASLRDLETRVNHVITEGALEGAARPVELSVRTIVDVLTGDDDVTPRERARVRTLLSQRDIDPDALTGAYVSYRTIKNHLNDCEHVDTSREGSPITPKRAEDTVGWSESKHRAIVRRTLERLRSVGEFEARGPVHVSIHTTVTCERCNTSTPLSAVLAGEPACTCSP